MQMDFDANTTPTETEVTDDLIPMAETFIDLATKRNWSEQTVTDEYHDADGSKWLWLKNKPVTEITSVEENTASLGDTADWVERTEGHADDFLLWKEEGKIRFHDNKPDKGYRNVKVSYKHGYTTTPDHITDLTIVLTSMFVVTAMTAPEMIDNLRGYSIGDLKVFKHGTSPKVQEYYNLFNRLLDMGGGRSTVVVA